MAKHLARIHGTEEDKVNCPFYFKIGACRHSDRCSRLHHKPAFSPTLLIKHLYRHPARQAELLSQQQQQQQPGLPALTPMTEEQAVEDFFCFFEDMYMEFSKFGYIEALHVVDNLGDHLIGHVYVKFADEEMASDALQVMNGRTYEGRVLEVEFSPVTDFREARCRDYDEETCARGGYCNFLHAKPVPPCLIRSLEEDAEMDRRRQEDERREREERSSSRKHKKRKRDRRDRGDDGDDDDDNEKEDDDDHHPQDGEGERDEEDRRRRKRSSSKHRKSRRDDDNGAGAGDDDDDTEEGHGDDHDEDGEDRRHRESKRDRDERKRSRHRSSRSRRHDDEAGDGEKDRVDEPYDEHHRRREDRRARGSPADYD